MFKPGVAAVDLWPDTTGFDADELVATDFRHADGRPANVFSSASPKTVDRHFRWMRDYGIDGATIAFIASGAALSAGIVTWLTAPSSESSSPQIALHASTSGFEVGVFFRN